MGLTQLNYKSSNRRSNKNLNYSLAKKHTIFSTSIRQLISPFSISQLPKNMDERFFKYFIKHLMDVKEIPKFQA